MATQAGIQPFEIADLVFRSITVPTIPNTLESLLIRLESLEEDARSYAYDIRQRAQRIAEIRALIAELPELEQAQEDDRRALRLTQERLATTRRQVAKGVR